MTCENRVELNPTVDMGFKSGPRHDAICDTLRVVEHAELAAERRYLRPQVIHIPL